MSVNTTQSLQSWTCIKCGAALPAEVVIGEVVTCGYCGTAFKLPVTQTRQGGINISGGSVTVGGSLVGGSVIVASESDAQSVVTLWDDATDWDDTGVTINGGNVRVAGDVVGGNLVQIGQPAPVVKVEPVAAVVPEVVAKPAPKLSWWEKVKRLLAN